MRALSPRSPSDRVLMEGMCLRRVAVEPREVVFLKGVIEASEGVAAVFAERGGELCIAAPVDQRERLDRILADLLDELDARTTGGDSST